GINYGGEQMIEQNEPFVYDKRVLWKRVGRIRRLIGFKLRVITMTILTSRMEKGAWAFLFSSLTLACIILTAGIAMFPFVMPSST
ncbi:packaged DNA stabilization protein, partial [Salmonella enterica subsp. enterica serovar Anatum]|nr:packaged DNA stabilization protein [Salmonella enterica subsp. enterica serovar Anatum]